MGNEQNAETLLNRSTSPSWLSVLTSSPTSTSVSASPVVVTPRRSTPSVKPSPSPSSPTTRSSSTSTPRTSSSRPSSSSTEPSSSPTTAAASPRSLVVRVPAPASRSLTVKRYCRSEWGQKLGGGRSVVAVEDTTGSAEKGLESNIPWYGNGFPIGICMALLLTDCKGSGRQMKSYKLTTGLALQETVTCSMNCLVRWTRSDIRLPFLQCSCDASGCRCADAPGEWGLCLLVLCSLVVQQLHSVALTGAEQQA